MQDDFAAELNGLRKQVTEGHDSQNKSELKINTLLANLRSLQDEKCNLESKLVQKQGTLQAQV